MAVHATQLKLKATGVLVDAELHDDLPLDCLFEAEEIWAPERVRFLRDCVHASVKRNELPQSVHWSWSLKAVSIPGFQLGPLSEYRLFGMKAEGAWQGLLIAKCIGHMSKLPPKPLELVYVDFIESAPWNWDLAKAGRVPRFRGTGLHLMDLALRWSVDLGFQGRTGLHSLPQAEPFYRDRCKMTDLGIDLTYKQPLRYFEFSKEQAKVFLGEV